MTVKELKEILAYDFILDEMELQVYNAEADVMLFVDRIDAPQSNRVMRFYPKIYICSKHGEN